MRVYLLSVLAVCGLGLVAMPGMARAADVEVNKDGVHVDAGTTSVDVGVKGMAASDRIVRLKDLTGLSVYNDNDESLGKIEDLVIDPAAGTIRYAVLSFGGILGIGDKYFAVPWRSLSFIPKGQTTAGTLKEDHCVLDVSKEALKSAPGFDKQNWPNLADRNWRASIDQYYGTQRSARGVRTMPR
jgi:sporulation protein YlmC with PRC-barrel domain